MYPTSIMIAYRASVASGGGASVMAPSILLPARQRSGAVVGLPQVRRSRPHDPGPGGFAAGQYRVYSVSRSPAGPHPPPHSPFTAPPSLVARSSLLSPGGAAPLWLAHGGARQAEVGRLDLVRG